MLSIDSPPRYFSATLPPPKTKMHAASTQVILMMIIIMIIMMMISVMMIMKIHIASTEVLMMTIMVLLVIEMRMIVLVTVGQKHVHFLCSLPRKSIVVTKCCRHCTTRWVGDLGHRRQSRNDATLTSPHPRRVLSVAGLVADVSQNQECR